jgi:hypothetical protein
MFVVRAALQSRGVAALHTWHLQKLPGSRYSYELILSFIGGVGKHKQKDDHFGRLSDMAEEGRFELPLQVSPD